MSEKIGRNDPCWCGSGRKYKRCHLEMDQNKSLIPDYQEKMKQTFSYKTCLAPFKNDCSNKIAKSHTVSRTSLSNIAVDGHVYHFKMDFLNELKNLKKDGIGIEEKKTFNPLNPDINVLRKNYLKPERIGINKSSTFNGFCEKHDREIFEDLENKSFIDSDKQYFLLFYRAVCRKLYDLEAGINMDGVQKEMFGEFLSLIMSNNAQLIDLRDIDKIKKEMDENIKNEKYYDINWFSIKTDNPPFMMVNEIFAPKYDCNSEKTENMIIIEMQNPSLLLDWIVVSSFSYKNENRISFIWHGDSNGTAKSLISSLFSDDANNISIKKVFSVAISSCENVYLSIPWWDNLSDDIKKKVSEKYTAGTGANMNCDPFKPIDIPVNEIKYKEVASNFNIDEFFK